MQTRLFAVPQNFGDELILDLYLAAAQRNASFVLDKKFGIRLNLRHHLMYGDMPAAL